jgi:cytochrome P450
MLDKILNNLPYLQIGLVLFIAWFLYGIVNGAAEERRIKELGGRAARRKALAPYGLDLLYNALKSAAKNQVMEFWLQNFSTYGNPSNPWTIEAGNGPRRIVLTADPENIKAILATQFQDYGKGENFNKDWHDFLGDSIFTTDGEKWHNSRQLIRPQFIKDRLSDIKVFEKHVKVLLPMLGGNGEVVNVADLFFRYTLDAATDFLLGRSVDSLTHEQARFAKAFNEVQHIQSIIARMGYWNNLMPRGKFHKELKVINEFVNTFIDDTLCLSPEELQKTTKSDEAYTFLHALASYTRDRNVLRDQLVAVMLAGRDTTACTLSWTIYELSRHSEVVEKLRQEMLQQVGASRMPTYADLKNMRYLQVSLYANLCVTIKTKIFV